MLPEDLLSIVLHWRWNRCEFVFACVVPAGLYYIYDYGRNLCGIIIYIVDEIMKGHRKPTHGNKNHRHNFETSENMLGLLYGYWIGKLPHSAISFTRPSATIYLEFLLIYQSVSNYTRGHLIWKLVLVICLLDQR